MESSFIKKIFLHQKYEIPTSNGGMFFAIRIGLFAFQLETNGLLV
jgi:hypothetical protein